MAIALTLAEYLSNHHLKYDEMKHRSTHTAMTTAHATGVPGECMAKGVLLRDEEGMLLAVIPGAHQLDMDKIRERLGHDVMLASEQDCERVFKDCDIGAVPACGMAYGLRTIWDESLLDGQDVYFEAGDHHTMLHMSAEEFKRMMAGADHARISTHM